MVNGDGRNEILSNNSFYLQLVTEETFSRLHLFLNRSVSSYFLGETKFTPGENGKRERERESVRDVDENFARSLIHTMIASLNSAKPSCAPCCADL